MKPRRHNDANEARTLRALPEVPPGRVVRVRSLTVEPTVGRRIADLGLTIGSTTTVVGRSRTAVVVAARGGRLAIGLPLAAGVLVEAETPEEPE